MAQSRYIPVTILNGQSASAVFFLIGGELIISLETPAAWTAADLAIQISVDGGVTFFNIFDNAGSANANCVAKVTTAAGELHVLALVSAGAGPLQFLPAGPIAFRLQSQAIGTLNAAAQGADRICQVLVGSY